MQNTAVYEYIADINSAIKDKNGPSMVALLKREHISTFRNELVKIKNLANFCNRVDAVFQAVVSNHLQSYLQWSEHKFEESYQYEELAVRNFKKAFESDTAVTWLIPVLRILIIYLRVTGRQADKELRNKGKKIGREEAASREINTFFRLCVGDRSAPEHSKKKAVMMVVNNLFRCYFNLNTINLCSNLIDTTEGPGFPPLSKFPISELVTYKFYSGQLAAFRGEYHKAHEALSLAFNRCPTSHIQNKRLILLYLIPVDMLRGRLPTPALLEKYGIKQFIPLVAAVKSGNLGEFNKALDQEEEFYIKKGIYLLLEKVRMLTYRNLFKKIHTAQGKPTKIFVKHCVYIINHWMKIETDTDEMMCIFANLIYNGMIKGYLSHTHSCVVVSDTAAFPNIRQIVKSNNLRW
uniref:PCI domain-containing protein n=1 Tax=Arcella intermedia TaxID=1963864 RepID=A0A6B2L5L5_9EUKA